MHYNIDFCKLNIYISAILIGDKGRPGAVATSIIQSVYESILVKTSGYSSLQFSWNEERPISTVPVIMGAPESPKQMLLPGAPAQSIAKK